MPSHHVQDFFEAIDGSQPLHVAAAGGHTEVAKVLRLSSIRQLSWIQFNGLNFELKHVETIDAALLG